MARICKRCYRANPAEAVYCHHDGALLDGDTHAEGGAIDVGAQPFPVPFIFPSGRACRCFNELALACHDDPAGARELLEKGYLKAFLGAQGRADLAGAAHAAAHAADRQRGLDDFLGRLPCTALAPPCLRVEPEVIDLGILSRGEDRHGELVLFNDGMRLLCGAASCDDKPWLALGEGQPLKRKQFQVSERAVLPFRVRGRHLPAYGKPREGEVRLESNGGTAVVKVRVQVPVLPFAGGVLAGATSPRQLAKQARESPREAAALIESGAVARWYEANGWSYPVRGPGASGMAAVQQLFEALGLVKAPQVELSEDALRLHGAPGAKVEYVLAVISQENRAAVAHGTSDQPWLRVGPTIFRGRSAFLPLLIPAVPPRAGETLHGQLTVSANGNQRFVVPVALAVDQAAPLPWPAGLPPLPTAVPAGLPPLPSLPAPPEIELTPLPVAAALPPIRPRRSRRGGGPQRRSLVIWAVAAGLGLVLALVLAVIAARRLLGR